MRRTRLPRPARETVALPDGRRIHVVRPRGQLFVCATGCCCGRTDGGFAAVPTQLYHEEWERRRLRNRVHLNIGGCLGPCALANVVLLVLDGGARWFHSVNTSELVLQLYDHVESLLARPAAEAAALPAPPPLDRLEFSGFAWDAPPGHDAS